MKKKIKEICDRYDVAIALAGGAIIVISGIAAVIAIAKFKPLVSDAYTMYTADGVINFIKAIDPSTKYAIFKETIKDAFQIVQL